MIRRFQRYRTRRTAKRYLLALRPALRQDYGHTGPYTPAQVLASLKRCVFNAPSARQYALAIFCDAAALAKLPAEYALPAFKHTDIQALAGAYGYFAGPVLQITADGVDSAASLGAGDWGGGTF